MPATFRAILSILSSLAASTAGKWLLRFLLAEAAAKLAPGVFADSELRARAVALVAAFAANDDEAREIAAADPNSWFTTGEFIPVQIAAVLAAASMDETLLRRTLADSRWADVLALLDSIGDGEPSDSTTIERPTDEERERATTPWRLGPTEPAPPPGARAPRAPGAHHGLLILLAGAEPRHAAALRAALARATGNGESRLALGLPAPGRPVGIIATPSATMSDAVVRDYLDGGGRDFVLLPLDLAESIGDPNPAANPQLRTFVNRVDEAMNQP